MSRDFDEAMERLAARQHGLVGHAQAAEAATREQIRHRLRTGRWKAAAPGVYRLAGAIVTPQCRLLVAVKAAGESAYASHQSAAALYAIPGFGFGVPDVTSPRPLRRELRDARVHHSRALPVWHVRTVDSIPATSVARTLFDLAGTVHPRRVERALDTSLGRGLVTVPACWRVVADLAKKGRSGTAPMRELLVARGDGYIAPASELEARLLEVLRDGGLPEPRREVDLGDPDGWIGRVELVYSEAGLLIEADSRRHHSALLDRARDEDRDNRFAAQGFRVLRVSWAMVTEEPERVARLVRDALRVAA